MPGRTPAEAVAAFIGPLQSTISCVAHAKITLSKGGRDEPGRVHALTLNNGVQLAAMKSAEHGGLLLDVKMQYRIIEVPRANRAERRHKWRVTTCGYMYSVETESSEVVFDYHWHPGSRTKTPHLHLGSAQLVSAGVVSKKNHFPTARISLESVVRACITEWGAEPLRPDWDQALALTEGRFRLYRSWSDTPPTDVSAETLPAS